MRLLLLCFAVILTFSGCSQEPLWRFIPQTEWRNVALGDTAISLVQYRYNSQELPFFLHLHHNEQTADSTLHAFLASTGGSAVGLYNNRQRLATFTIKGKRYRFDPNRMFTPAGIRQSMQLLSSYQPDAASAVSKLADTLLNLLPNQQPVVAVHNNTDGAYSLDSYAAGGSYASETEALFRNAEMDPDDFVLTTHPLLFAHLQQAGINAVLQRNATAADDGSLGYWMGRQNRIYVNIEAEHGHGAEQARLITAVVRFFEANR